MITSRLVAVAVFSALCAAANADESRFGASLNGLVDDADAQSVDANLAYAPSNWLELGAGYGRIDAPTRSSDGTIMRASADFHSERYAFKPYYREWNSRDFDSDTLGARASFTTGGLTLSAAGETRGFAVDYGDGTTATGNRHFSSTGWGGGLRYARSGWAAHADAMFYGSRTLTQYVQQNPVATTGGGSTGGGSTGGTIIPGVTLPGAVAGVPLVSSSLLPLPQAILAATPGVTRSIVTVEEGALDHLYTAGIEHAFPRASLSLDWTGAKESALGNRTDSYSLGVHVPLSAHFNVGATLGTTDSYVGSTTFGGLAIGFQM